MKNESVLVVFGEELPHGWRFLYRYDVVVASEALRESVEVAGIKFVPLEPLVGPGSIYEASALVEELSYMKLADGTRIAKSFLYEGYELWWIHYQNLYLYFCLPYTQYQNLLEYLKSFRQVHLYRPAYKSLFSCYLQAHGSEIILVKETGFKGSSFLPFGVFLQMSITLLSLPILMIQKRRLMIFTGDKFEKSRDYDFRLKFIYEELRQKKIPFVEFIRGLESWRTVVQHAYTRKRPVIYSEAVAFVGKFASILSGGRYRARRVFGAHRFISETDPETRFKSLVATQYLLGVYDDVWAIRIMKWILRAMGVTVAFIPAATERNFHAVLGCKLNAIPTIGILHGLHSRYYNVYEFMPGFDGEKVLSIDTYGLWSKWWQAHFREHSKAYKPEQLYVSGPMRPLEASKDSATPAPSHSGPVRVLFIAEQNAIPTEVMPYLRELLGRRDIALSLKFRPYRDGFEQWLLQHEPDIFKQDHLRIVKGTMQDAIKDIDVAVGCQSTGVLETVLQLKVPLYFRTQKWGDYYNLKEYDATHSFFAETPGELIEKIHTARSVSVEALKDLQERYFGDPHMNGSKWVVEQIEKYLT